MEMEVQYEVLLILRKQHGASLKVWFNPKSEHVNKCYSKAYMLFVDDALADLILNLKALKQRKMNNSCLSFLFFSSKSQLCEWLVTNMKLSERTVMDCLRNVGLNASMPLKKPD